MTHLVRCNDSGHAAIAAWGSVVAYDAGGLRLNDLDEESLTALDDVELLHRVDAIVSQFDDLDPREAGEALGALAQELGERHSPDVVLAHFRRLLEERDDPNDVLAREL